MSKENFLPSTVSDLTRQVQLVQNQNRKREEGQSLRSLELERVVVEKAEEVFGKDQQHWNEEQKRRLEEVREFLAPIEEIILGRMLVEAGIEEFDEVKSGAGLISRKSMQDFQNELKSCLQSKENISDSFENLILKLRREILGLKQEVSQEDLDLQAEICEEMANNINSKIGNGGFARSRQKSLSMIGINITNIPDKVFEPYFRGGYLNVLLVAAGVEISVEKRKENEANFIRAKGDILGMEALFSGAVPNINLLGVHDLDYEENSEFFAVSADPQYAKPESKNYLEDNQEFFRECIKLIRQRNMKKEEKTNILIKEEPSSSFEFSAITNLEEEKKKKKDCCVIL